MGQSELIPPATQCFCYTSINNRLPFIFRGCLKFWSSFSVCVDFVSKCGYSLTFKHVPLCLSEPPAHICLAYLCANYKGTVGINIIKLPYTVQPTGN